MEDIMGEIVKGSWDLRVRRKIWVIGIEMERIFGIKRKGGYEINGKREGIWELFYENRKIHYKKNYKNGKRTGLHETFYINGTIAMRINYRNGQLNGIYEEFYKNGKIFARRNYRNGKLNETSEEFYDYEYEKDKLVK